MKNNIIFVVPLYINHISLYPIVERFFQSLRDNYPLIKVIVLDDASPLPHGFPVDMRHGRNEGFTKTVNDLLECAFNTGAKTVVVLNDDLTIKPGDLDKFVKLEGKTIASPMDTASSDDDRFGAVWGITKEAYDVLGKLDEKYKHFFSDLEYYHRAKAKGIKVIKWKEIVVDHIESGTYKHTKKDVLLLKDQMEYNHNYERTSSPNTT